MNAIHVSDSNREEKLALKKEVVRSLPFFTRWAVVEPPNLATYPHPTTVWDWGIFLGQPAKLYYQ